MPDFPRGVAPSPDMAVGGGCPPTEAGAEGGTRGRAVAGVPRPEGSQLPVGPGSLTNPALSPRDSLLSVFTGALGGLSEHSSDAESVKSMVSGTDVIFKQNN